MPKRLAITISGAVSLGSYEAGVLYEIIDAIRQHNTHSDTLKNPDEKIVIDVITGASAGGMTAAIAAQKLLFDADALLGANTNAFYLPWVKRVDLTKLLDLHGNDDGHDSILSSALVQEIAREFLTARYANGNPVSQPHPAAADKIRLGLAMSNLNGVDHSVATFGDPNGTFGYTRFQDEFRRPYTNWANEPVADLADTLDTWKQVQQAAVACGAFPFAFRVQQVQRFAEEFPKGATHSRQSLAYAYTDGGVFQNEPLGMAKAFVNDIDEHRNAESRFYLYVSPDAKSSSSDGTFIAQDATLLAAGKHLIGSIFSQARSQDWVRAEQINGQVRKFDDTALKLKNLLKDKKSNVTADTLVGPSNALLSILFAKDVTDKEKDEARKRLRDQYTPEYQDLVTTLGETRTANAWI